MYPLWGTGRSRFARIRADGGAGIPNQRRDCESGPCRRCWHCRPATAAIRWLGHRRAVAARSPRSGAAPLSKAKFDGPAEQPAFRLDAEHGVPSGHLKRARRPAKKTRRAAAAAKQHAPGDRPLAILAWVTLLLGTAGFVAGLALMGWSMDSERQDLWAIGAPIILAGQIVLILGLVLQLDRIWRDSRWAAARLETVNEQLHELITTTTLLGDLKGQLDLLAVKLSRQ